MKLDIDCVRDVLLQCEEIPLNGHMKFSDLSSSLPKYTEDEVAYTCLKLSEADYLHIVTKAYGSEINVARINDISFKGHEFLNNIRSQTIFDKLKELISELGIKSLDGADKIATAIISALIKHKLGI